MSKTYIDIEQLDALYRKYDIPYTNVFDELHQYSAEDIAEKMTVTKLCNILENKEEVFTVKLWQKEDIAAVMRSMNILPDDELMAVVMETAKKSLEDRSDDFDRLRNKVKECKKRMNDQEDA